MSTYAGKSEVSEMVASNPVYVSHKIESADHKVNISDLLAKAEREIIRQNSFIELTPPVNDISIDFHNTKKCMVWQGKLHRHVTVTDQRIPPIPGTPPARTVKVLFLVDLVKYRYQAEYIPKDETL